MADSDDATPSVGGVTDGAGAGRVHGTLQIDGEEVGVRFDDRILQAAEERDEVDLSVVGDADGFDLAGQSDDGAGATIPVHDVVDHNLTSSSRFSDAEFRFIEDDQIRKLEENGVWYTERVGDWILAKDDLVPSVKERIKAMILGEDGMSVDPADPDSEADQNLADHLRDIYDDDVRPAKVIDTILAENFKNARSVLRATDLLPLDLRDLQFVRDGETGQEIYWQDDVTVTTFDVEDGDGDADGPERDISIDTRDVPAQPLVIGDQVFDIALYDQPPLEAVADTAVNKKVMQRIKARKAEITSFGGIVMKVDPPAWLDEDEWFERTEDDDGNQITKLERALRDSLSNAHDWVKEYQSGTTGAIPMHWEIEQVEIPETDDPIDDQIRGYNKDIARRLLVPLDLIELREGAELSRETLFATLLTTIEGWRSEIKRVFDQFADAQKEIHDVSGDVTHTFPRLGAEDEEQIVQLLQFAGVAGLSQREVRQLLNQALEGVDLDISEAGPEDDELDQDLQDKSQEMRRLLEEQRRGPAPGDGEDGEDSGGGDGDGGTPDDGGAEASPTRRDVLDRLEAAEFSEGDKVRLGDGTRGVVTEVRTSTFEGPDGEEHDATEDSPVYVVATVEGAVAVRGSELEGDDWSTGEDNPEEDLADVAQAAVVDLLAAAPPGFDAREQGTLSLQAGPTDWDFPPSWRKSETPARLILLDAWSSMGGQFDCGGGCCKGEMMSSGMSDRASDQFCAAMKDRVLMWEGWRRGGASAVGPGSVTAADNEGDAGDPPGWFRRARRRLRTALTGARPGRDVLRDVPVLPDPAEQGPTKLTRADLARWFLWEAAGRPELEADWNPALHPRGPDGQFVERPWDIPDGLMDIAQDADAPELLRRLDEQADDVDVEALLQDPDIRIDGVPEDATRVDDLPGDGDDDGGGVVQFEDIESLDDLSPGDTFVRNDEPRKVVEIHEDPDNAEERWIEYADQSGEQFFIREDFFLPESATETRDRTAVEEELEDDFGVQTANLSGLSEDAQEDVREGLDDIWTDDFGDSMPILQLTTELPENDQTEAEERSSAAFYRGSDRTLYLRPESFEDAGGEGDTFAFDDRKGMVHHEAGHARHFISDPEKYGELRDRRLSEPEKAVARQEVSSYAAYNPHEFVAEVFAGLQAGKDYPDTVMEKYQEFGGPEVSR